MKKNISVVIFIIFIFMLNGCTGLTDCNSMNFENEEVEELVYEEIVDKIIRFHVIANSNSDEDQELKLKVRDRVIEYVSDKLKNSKSLDESREFINNNKKNIEDIANAVISENGYSYKVNSSISKVNFPDKVYGDVIFPQGEYEAYRIIIGEGNGENWWCVMFPPLCFVDGTKEAIDSTKVIDSLSDNSQEENEIQFKSKVYEILFENKS